MKNIVEGIFGGNAGEFRVVTSLGHFGLAVGVERPRTSEFGGWEGGSWSLSAWLSRMMQMSIKDSEQMLSREVKQLGHQKLVRVDNSNTFWRHGSYSSDKGSSQKGSGKEKGAPKDKKGKEKQ
ncbi:hypothetical protein BT96DRAFT_942309 [Gymnopus androsaceus JB14]|uniref:Uncharacterized protein n=1 Tax=Gymnopus androsaceus JB14 TaxID=1447944 RepID=A0A6A4HCP7_9AGAR|nr:hypothetical protein BT96DRAFT_942309 [Gymnopus androsaceus JB14]